MLKYLLIILLIVFLGTVIFFMFIGGSHRDIAKEEVSAFNAVTGFLARLEVDKPITIDEAGKFIQVNKGNNIDGTLLFIYKINPDTIKYSLALELIRINKNVFRNIDADKHKPITLIARGYSHGREPGLVYGVLKSSDRSIFMKYGGLNWQPETTVAFFPTLHTYASNIVISGIIINGKPLMQILGLVSDKGFVDKEKEIKFLRHIVKIMPQLADNPIIKEKLKLDVPDQTPQLGSDEVSGVDEGQRKVNLNLSKETAIKIAEVILSSIYGEKVLEQRPWKVTETETEFKIKGTLHGTRRVGGVAEIVISKADARVIRYIHGR